MKDSFNDRKRRKKLMDEAIAGIRDAVVDQKLPETVTVLQLSGWANGQKACKPFHINEIVLALAQSRGVEASEWRNDKPTKFKFILTREERLPKSLRVLCRDDNRLVEFCRTLHQEFSAEGGHLYNHDMVEVALVTVTGQGGFKPADRDLILEGLQVKEWVIYRAGRSNELGTPTYTITQEMYRRLGLSSTEIEAILLAIDPPAEESTPDESRQDEVDVQTEDSSAGEGATCEESAADQADADEAETTTSAAPSLEPQTPTPSPELVEASAPEPEPVVAAEPEAPPAVEAEVDEVVDAEPAPADPPTAESDDQPEPAEPAQDPTEELTAEPATDAGPGTQVEPQDQVEAESVVAASAAPPVAVVLPTLYLDEYDPTLNGVNDYQVDRLRRLLTSRGREFSLRAVNPNADMGYPSRAVVKSCISGARKAGILRYAHPGTGDKDTHVFVTAEEHAVNEAEKATKTRKKK